MWLKTDGVNQSHNDKVLAWDSIGKTIGIWDGWCFESITGDYAFDAEYSDGMDFFTEGEGKLIGRITHWMPLPNKPTTKKNAERRATVRQQRKQYTCPKCAIPVVRGHAGLWVCNGCFWSGKRPAVA